MWMEISGSFKVGGDSISGGSGKVVVVAFTAVGWGFEGRFRFGAVVSLLLLGAALLGAAVAAGGWAGRREGTL